MPDNGKRHAAALLFLTSGMTTFDAYSTLMSSPWTAENVGADPEKAGSAREYYRHAVCVSVAYSVGAAIVAGQPAGWWALIGAGAANAYLIWLYERAIMRAEAAGSGGGWLRGEAGNEYS